MIHITKKEVVPQTKAETKRIVKKVIQPIIKDVIQPVHVRIKPVLQEGVKPTIFKGDEVRPVINQGTKTIETIYKETKVEKEVNAGVKVRDSIVRSTVLPTDNKGVIVKKEIISTNAIGLEGQGVNVGLGLEGVQVSQAINAEGIHKEIVTGTKVRQSIVRSSVLPTIDGGVKVLKPIFGGVRQSTVKDGGIIGVGGELSSGAAGMGLTTSTTTNNVITGTTTTHKTIDLGTTVHKTIDLGVVNKGVTGTFNTGEVITDPNFRSNEVQLVSSEGNQFANSGLTFTSSKIGTNQNQGMEVMEFGNKGNIDNNNNNQVQLGGIGTNATTQFVTTGPTTTTATTRTVKYTTGDVQPIIGEQNILEPIVKTTVKQPITTGSTMNIQNDQNLI